MEKIISLYTNNLIAFKSNAIQIQATLVNTKFQGLSYYSHVREFRQLCRQVEHPGNLARELMLTLGEY